MKKFITTLAISTLLTSSVIASDSSSSIKSNGFDFSLKNITSLLNNSKSRKELQESTTQLKKDLSRLDQEILSIREKTKKLTSGEVCGSGNIYTDTQVLFARIATAVQKGGDLESSIEDNLAYLINKDKIIRNDNSIATSEKDDLLSIIDQSVQGYSVEKGKLGKIEKIITNANNVITSQSNFHKHLCNLEATQDILKRIQKLTNYLENEAKILQKEFNGLKIMNTQLGVNMG